MSRESYSLVAAGSRHGFLAPLALISLILLASSLQAAELVDVRVALHEGFTRVVFEADGPFQHRLPEPNTPLTDGARIWLDTATASRTASIAGDRLPTVRLEPRRRF